MTRPIASRDAEGPISRREAFVSHGALSARGHTGPGDQLLFGSLPQEHRDAISKLKDVDYAVYSYKTPIAVHSQEKGFIIPKVKYSTTTSKHQGITRRGAGKSDRPMMDKAE
jgi:hypothetical protein